MSDSPELSTPLLGRDLFLWDRATGESTQITAGNGLTHPATLSSDGSRVAFASSAANNLVPDDTNGFGDLFIWDAATDTTTRLTDTDSNSNFLTFFEGDFQISGDGRSIAFSSSATNLVAPDTNGHTDVFVWDEGSGISLVARTTSAADDVSINDDGTRITFSTDAPLEPGDTNGKSDSYLWDRG